MIVFTTFSKAYSENTKPKEGSKLEIQSLGMSVDKILF